MQRQLAQIARSAVLAGLSLAAAHSIFAQESKSVPANQESPTVTAPEKAPEKRPNSTPTVLKEASTPSKVLRYSQYLLGLYDTDRDGILQQSEWKSMHGKPELIDTNGDGDITAEEITRWVMGYGRRKQSGNNTTPEPVPESTPATKPGTSPDPEAPPQVTSTPNGERGVEHSKETKFYVSPKRLPVGLPEWFPNRDADGDGQLTFSEYSPNNIAAELAEFESYDANGDGVVTAKECVGKNSAKASAKNASDSRGQSVTKQSRGKKKTKDTP